MKKEREKEIKNLIKENPKHFYWKIRKQFPRFFQAVKQNKPEIDTFSEAVYLHLFGEGKRECNYFNCNNLCNFRSFSEGYYDYCSQACSNKNRELRECIVCETEFEVKKSKDKKLCSRECWREWNAREEVQKKFQKSREETLQERYGDKNYRNVQKAKKTKREKYGDPSYNNIEKIKNTIEERYGGMGFDSEVISEDIKETNLERHGVENPSKLEKFKKKASLQKKKEGYKKICSDEGRFEYLKPLFEFSEYEGRYKSQAIEYKFECLRCNEEFIDIIRYPIRPRCPNCFPLETSKIEKEFQDFISSFLSCEVKMNYYGLLKGNREVDVYIPEKDIAIEFDGIYWHSENGGRKCGRKYHLNKTEECEEKGIQLIHVFENEWIEKKSIVKDRLKYILGEYDGEKIYARNTELREVETSEKNKFLEENHLQGKDRSNVKLGLFYNDELKSLMTFSRRRVALGGDPDDESWELSRFCSECSVVGGAGKLFKNFIRKCDPRKIITYADRRWSSLIRGIFYEKIGFDFDGFVRPSYFYFDEKDRLNLMHRFNFRKNVLEEKLDEFDPELTEWENMQINGYDRIWDCGKIRYIWKKN